jgi:hypothetical protein
VPYTRHELRRIIGDLGEPYLVVRLDAADDRLTGSPRLPVDQVIQQHD